MKRLLIIFSILGVFVSSSVLAAAVCPAPKPKCLYVTVPTQCAGWHVGAEALYLQPTAGDLDYAINASGPVGATMKSAVVKPKNKLGFGIDADYHFAGTGNDLLAHYEHLQTTDSDSIGDGRLTIADRFISPGFTATPYNYANAQAKFKYNAFDLLLGQLVDVGKKLQMQMVAGLRCADLDSSINANYINLTSGTDTAYLQSSFTGLGPRFAINGNYDVYRGFGVDAIAGSSLLIGTLSSKNYVSAPRITSYTIKHDKKAGRYIVPELDAKLGLSYKRSTSKGSFIIKAGWQVINYFSAQERMMWVDNAISSWTYTNNCTNISFNGPYLGFVFKTA